MADLQRTIELIFLGTDKTASALSAVGRNINSVSTKVEALAQPFANIADGVLRADAAITALVGAGLAYAYDQFKDFESATVDLQKVLTDVSGLEDAKQKALDLSNTYGIASVEILTSMAGFKQAGFDLSDSMALTESSLQLVIAGEVDSASSMEILIATLKGFDAPASKANDLLDLLNSVSSEYATNVDELASGMAALSPIASTMGFSMEETAGILTPVIEVFRSGDEAAVALKTTLLKLVDDSKPVQDALASLGVSQKDANGEFRSGKDILYDVMAAFDGLNDNQKSYTAMQLTGIDQSGRAITVFDNLSKVLAITKTAYDKNFKAIDEVNLKLQTAEYAVARFGTAWSNLAVVVGAGFADATTEVINGGTDIEIALQKAVQDGAFDTLLDAFKDLGTDIAVVLKEVAENLPEALEGVDYSHLIDALRDLGGELASFFGMDGTDPKDLTSAIQTVVDVLTMLTNITSGIVVAFEPYFTAMREAAQGSGDLSAQTTKDFGEIIGAAKAIVTFGLKLVLIFEAMDKAGASWSNTLVISFNSIGIVIDTLQSTLVGLVLAFVNTLDEILGAVRIFDKFALFGLFSEDIDAAQEKLNGWSQGLNKSLNENIKDITREIGNISKAISDVPDEKGTDFRVDNTEALKKIREYDANLDAVTGTKEADITVDTESAEGSLGTISGKIGEIPSEKTIDIDVTGDDALKVKLQAMEDATNLTELSISEASGVIKSKLEWEAKLDIAAVQATAAQSVALAVELSAAWESSGDVMSTAFGVLGDWSGSSSKFYDVLHLAEDETKIRQELLDLQKDQGEAQKDLIQSQASYYAAKAANIKSGQAMITVDGTGLEPELEAFMWKILEAVQVRATEEASEFLLGI